MLVIVLILVAIARRSIMMIQTIQLGGILKGIKDRNITGGGGRRSRRGVGGQGLVQDGPRAFADE